MFARPIMLAFQPALRSAATRSFISTRTPFGIRAGHHQSPFTHSFSTAQKTRPKARIPWQSVWRNSPQRNYARQAFNYQRYEATKGLFRKWAARPTFYYEVGGISVVFAGFYTYNLETVQVSGRRRFNIISPEFEKRMSEGQYEQTLQQFGPKIMSSRSSEHKQVERVLQRLLPHSGIEGDDWKIHVINDDMKNAFVIPGGKVFVFRGILDVCQGDDGLAAVLGHEIAHNVAHHAAERISQAAPLLVLPIISYLFGFDMGLTRFVTSLVLELPGSRKQEEEADYIGLLMMAESCYNPTAAMGLWSRMEVEEKKAGGAPPQFLSTHPSSHNRLEKIRGWLPEAENKLEDGECGTTQMYAQSFDNSMSEFMRWR